MSASLNPVSPEAPAPAPSVSSPKIGLFERMNAVGKKARRFIWVPWILAVIVHGAGAGTASLASSELDTFVRLVQERVAERLNATIDIEQIASVEPEPPEPEPEPEAPAEPEPEEPEPEEPVEPPPLPVEPEVVPDEPVPTPQAPPPAAAEAAEVLTSPEEPLDLTGQGFISGTGTRFSGGVTAAQGTAKTAVRDRAASGSGKPGGTGDQPNAPTSAVDLSRPAGLPVGANWSSCPFPAEADAEQINQAAVRVVVVVDASGNPTSVNVLSDPGYGFGRQAQKCAMRFKYPAGLDKSGNPIARATRPFRITFTR